jgi:hypothetical protein
MVEIILILSILIIIMGRIDPVECIGVSGQRNGNALNVKPPAMRVRDECYTKNHLPIMSSPNSRIFQAFL